MSKLILVRHGHTGLNQPGKNERLRAWKDIPLDEQGLREAAMIAERLEGESVDFICTSDLQRARQTAQAVSAATGAPVIATESLRPWNLGTLAGKRVSDCLDILSQLQKFPDRKAPDGESLREFFHRYSVHLRALMAIAERSRRCIVIVTHVRNFLAAPLVLAGGDAHRIPVKGGPRTGSVLVMEKRGREWDISALPEPAEATIADQFVVTT
jgi:broad specificity phosphatase PhoE